MKICLVKTSSMGDVLHALPALTDAQLALPNLAVDWVVEENFAEIPSWHSAVRNVIPIALRRWRKAPFVATTRQQWRAYRQQLQAQQYDAVIDAQGLLKSALFATRLAKGEKFGYAFDCAREPLASLFYQHKFSIPYQQHAVQRIRQLLAQSLGYTLPCTMGDYGIAQHFQTATTTPYVLFVHGTTRADKLWTEAQWQALGLALNERGYQVRLPWGNPTEFARAQRLAKAMPNAQVLPALSLTEVAQQIAQSQALVSVDTGLSHLAAALDKANVCLYGATDPKLIGSYGKHQIHLTGSSMAQIEVGNVLNALEGLLGIK